jgi:hypothetical protein
MVLERNHFNWNVLVSTDRSLQNQSSMRSREDLQERLVEGRQPSEKTKARMGRGRFVWHYTPRCLQGLTTTAANCNCFTEERVRHWTHEKLLSIIKHTKGENFVFLVIYNGSRRGSTWPRGYTPCWQLYTNKTPAMPFIATKSVTCMSTSWLLGNVYTAKLCKGKKRDPDALKLGLVS